MSITAYPNGISSFGSPIYGDGSSLDNSGTKYFVDNNSGNDGNLGDSWEYPLKTLARAVTLNNLDIARGSDRWARRNTIFYCADTEAADLVAFPNKCDVIGCGSYDANSKPGITGNHVPVNAGNYGTRFINIWFKAPADAAPIVTLASSSSGIQFINCTFSATATTTHAIQATASPFMKVRGCRFEGAVTTAVISILAGQAGGTEIVGNDILESAAVGILINASTTSSWLSFIKGNFIHAATFCVDDNSDLFALVRNDMVSLADDYATGLDINSALAVGNEYTAPNVAGPYPILDTTT